MQKPNVVRTAARTKRTTVGSHAIVSPISTTGTQQSSPKHMIAPAISANGLITTPQQQMVRRASGLLWRLAIAVHAAAASAMVRLPTVSNRPSMVILTGSSQGVPGKQSAAAVGTCKVVTGSAEGDWGDKGVRASAGARRRSRPRAELAVRPRVRWRAAPPWPLPLARYRGHVTIGATSRPHFGARGGWRRCASLPATE